MAPKRIAEILRFSTVLILCCNSTYLKRYVQCLFQYHGAEHKVVYNFESGKLINIKTAQQFITQHPRCGTSFVFILMLVTIITYAMTDSLVAYLGIISFTIPIRILFHLFLLPLVTGIGYEVLKFLAKKQNNFQAVPAHALN